MSLYVKAHVFMLDTLNSTCLLKQSRSQFHAETTANAPSALNVTCWNFAISVCLLTALDRGCV